MGGRRTPIVAAVFLLLSVAARADTLRFSGRAFQDAYAPTVDPGTSAFPFAGTSAWLEIDPALAQTTQARVIFTADALEASPAGLGGGATSLSSGSGPNGAVYRAGIREAWVDRTVPGLELRAGRQIIPWGKADVINPTDFNSARDSTVFNPDPEVQRLGVTSLLAIYGPEAGASPWTFTAVWTPVAPESRVLLPPVAIPSSITLLPAQPSVASLSNSELALKAAYQGQGWDASVVGFRGQSALPELTVSGGTVVVPVFRAIRAAGGDFSFTAGSWTIRGESAYTWTDADGTAQIPISLPSHWDTVLGVERPLGSSFRVQAQLYWRLLPDFTPTSGPVPPGAEIAQGVAQANQLLLNYQNASLTAGTFRFSYSEDSIPWEAEIFLIQNFVGGDYLLRPKLAYAWSDSLKTALGAEYYGGPGDRPLGALHPYSSVFAEARVLW